jgi:hypothetical protein
MEEHCYKHSDRIAVVWREAFIFGEPDRVCLCAECALQDLKFSIIYPLTNRKMKYDKYSI